MVKSDQNGPNVSRLRRIVPSLMTVASCCLGVTAVRMAVENNFYASIGAVCVAGLLDLLDGPVARHLKVDDGFGEVFDSLADAISFGVAPALILYYWALEGVPLGWSVSLFYCSCCCLRLARYNRELSAPDDPTAKKLPRGFFRGVPAPGAAALALLPITMMLGLTHDDWMIRIPSKIIDAVSIPYVLQGWMATIGLLMVSPIPTVSFREIFNLPRRFFPLSIPLLLIAVIGLIEFTMTALIGLAAVYLVAQPFGWYRLWKSARADR